MSCMPVVCFPCNQGSKSSKSGGQRNGKKKSPWTSGCKKKRSSTGGGCGGNNGGGGGRKFICLEAGNDCNGNGGENGSSQEEKKRSFMDDVWKVMTPDMIEKLTEILVADFNLSREEASKFINEQKEANKQAQKVASGKCPCSGEVTSLPGLEARNEFVQEMVDVMACKLSDYVAMMVCARKSDRQEVLKQTILENLEKFFGEGDSEFKKVLDFGADKLSLWLDLTFPAECPPKRKSSTKSNAS